MKRCLIAMLLLIAAIIIIPGVGHGQTPPREEPREQMTWAMVGESKHWVVILHGYARKEHGRVTYAHATPWLIWTGGDQPPTQFSVDFSVDSIHCIHGTLGAGGSKLSLVAHCKLVYPQSPSIPGDTSQDFIDAIRKSGRFVLQWNHSQETIRWGRAFPEGLYPQQ